MSTSALTDGQRKPQDFRELLATTLREFMVPSASQLELLDAHYRLLLKWNARMNLTAVTAVGPAVQRHYSESIFLGEILNSKEQSSGRRVLDVGSGAGFPGFPIAVLRPDWQVTLVESNHRKSTFLSEAARLVPNVMVLSQRAEALQGSWDDVVSRAVRHDDVCNVAIRTSRRIALLIGKDDFDTLPAYILWDKPIALPWGERRIVAMGDVPRGTSD